MNPVDKKNKREKFINYRLHMYKYYKDFIEMKVTSNYNKCYNTPDAKFNETINNLYQVDTDMRKQHMSEMSKYNKSRGRRRKQILFMYFLREHAFTKITLWFNCKQTKLYGQLPYTNIKIDQSLPDNYDQYLTMHSMHYQFIQSIKEQIKNMYDAKIERIYKQNYHPTNVDKLLNEGHTIDEAFSILDKNITFHI